MDYKSDRWRRLRERALARDRWQCRQCARYGVARAASVVHHVRPAESFPDYRWELSNLISLCPTCHNAMHVRGGHELSDLGRTWVRRTPPPKAPCTPLAGTGEGRTSSEDGANRQGGSGSRRY